MSTKCCTFLPKREFLLQILHCVVEPAIFNVNRNFTFAFRKLNVECVDSGERSRLDWWPKYGIEKSRAPDKYHHGNSGRDHWHIRDEAVSICFCAQSKSCGPMWHWFWSIIIQAQWGTPELHLWKTITTTASLQHDKRPAAEAFSQYDVWHSNCSRTFWSVWVTEHLLYLPLFQGRSPYNSMLVFWLGKTCSCLMSFDMV